MDYIADEVPINSHCDVFGHYRVFKLYANSNSFMCSTHPLMYKLICNSVLDINTAITYM